jgi:hypothetical protein
MTGTWAGWIPEEAGRLLAGIPFFWWDHVVCLLGTGLRFGESAGLRRRRVHLDRAMPVLQVVDTRYQAGRFGSGFKSRPKSDAGIREVPWLPCWSRRLVTNSRLASTPTTWSSPALAAATVCPPAHGQPCRVTASVACTRAPHSGPATSRTCSSVAP